MWTLERKSLLVMSSWRQNRKLDISDDKGQFYTFLRDKLDMTKDWSKRDIFDKTDFIPKNLFEKSFCWSLNIYNEIFKLG